MRSQRRGLAAREGRAVCFSYSPHVRKVRTNAVQYNHDPVSGVLDSVSNADTGFIFWRAAVVSGTAQMPLVTSWVTWMAVM